MPILYPLKFVSKQVFTILIEILVIHISQTELMTWIISKLFPSLTLVTDVMTWLQAFLYAVGETMPHEEKCKLPSGMSKSDVLDLIRKDGIPVSTSTFYRIWGDHFVNVVTTKVSSLKIYY